MIKGKKLVSLLGAIVVASTLLVGCGNKTSETVSFFNYGANIDQETLKEFEKQYGIKVKMDEFDDMETMYLKLSGSDVKYDVVLVSDALMPRMIEEGLLQEINHEHIPNLSQMDEEYLNLSVDPGNKYSVPYMFGTIGIIYNKDVVSEKVDSWTSYGMRNIKIKYLCLIRTVIR